MLPFRSYFEFATFLPKTLLYLHIVIFKKPQLCLIHFAISFDSQVSVSLMERIGGVIDGFPSGITIDEEFVQQELNRRRPGTINPYHPTQKKLIK